MERNYQFKIGQRVHTYEDGERLFGEVTEVIEDKIFIKWEIESEPWEYERSDFYKIFVT